MMAGKTSKPLFKDARIKARAAREACGYDPGTPEEGDDKNDVVRHLV